MGSNALSALLAGGARRTWRESVQRARKDIFGSTRGMPGEEEWMKPLRGRSRNRWYWPSKYLHADFSLRHYLAMQLKRLEKRKEHPAILQLWDTVKLFSTHTDELMRFMGKVDENTFKKSTTLQDAHALLQIISGKSSLPFKIETAVEDSINSDKFQPYIKYALKPLADNTVTNTGAVNTVRERNKFRQILIADPGIVAALNVRNRFVDALYLRRRAYYLEKLSRKKPVSETIQKYRKHFLTHPDHKVIWPENKGISQHSWPSR